MGNTQFSAVFSCMLWHIELEFCTWLCFNVLQIKFECHYFASIFEGVMPLCELRIWEIHSFPHFSPTCFDILSWNCAHDFVFMYYRASSSVISLRQFLKELCLFWNLEYRKYRNTQGGGDYRFALCLSVILSVCQTSFLDFLSLWNAFVLCLSVILSVCQTSFLDFLYLWNALRWDLVKLLLFRPSVVPSIRPCVDLWSP